MQFYFSKHWFHLFLMLKSFIDFMKSSPYPSSTLKEKKSVLVLGVGRREETGYFLKLDMAGLTFAPETSWGYHGDITYSASRAFTLVAT